MFDTVTDANICTPPANSYIIEPTELLLAHRILEGSDWFGLLEIPASLNDFSKVGTLLGVASRMGNK